MSGERDNRGSVGAVVAPGIEWLKWLGLFAMLYDHVSEYVLPLPFAASVGAYAFPFFALALVSAVAGHGPAKATGVAVRCLKWGIVAQLAVLVVRDPVPFNVLFTLGAGLYVGARIRQAVERNRVTGTAALKVAACVLLGSASEFSLPGVALVTVAYLAAVGHVPSWTVYVPAALLFPFNEMSFAALLAVWVAGIILVDAPRVPRVPGLFYPAYVLQWPFLGMLR